MYVLIFDSVKIIPNVVRYYAAQNDTNLQYFFRTKNYTF